MKRIIKKSIVKLPLEKGVVSNTLEVSDPTTTAPSTEIIEQMTNIPKDGIIAFDSFKIPEGYNEVLLSDIIPVATASNNGLMSNTDKQKMEGLSSVITVTKSMNLSAANTWYDVGISGGGTLTTGTYIVQVDVTSFAGQANHWLEKYSGVMSWYSGGTNSSEATEVYLHNAGHADNGAKISIRTLRQPSGGTLKLQIATTVAMTAARNIIFKFRKIM